MMRIGENQSIFVTFGKTNFEDCLREVIRKYEAAIENRNQIKQSISNLLDNASKFTPRGGEIKIVVEVKNTHIYFHIELHGGEIWIESEVGKGTTFYATYCMNRY